MNTQYSPKESRHIVHKARDLCDGLGASIRVVRVATGFIELDVSVAPSLLDELIGRLRPIGGLDNIRHVTEEEEITKDEGIVEGISYFNGERFWEAHEAWEGAWKKCSGDEKSLVQGIILVAVAFAHSQKNDDDIGINMFGRALEKMGEFAGIYHNIDVGRIRSKITAMMDERRMELFRI
ncbi:conserved hypothetical protein [Cenarchaeum symbiosum A]|uniref:DUF309 domain-containing protein n=1 Tax=Cenarchaeum symbiosum (strain A) TaxID=414004 RepID=A0RUP8_CENSY|nr:conserved hypothetical protein [Cenarchaeum symbiosum A]